MDRNSKSNSSSRNNTKKSVRKSVRRNNSKFVGIEMNLTNILLFIVVCLVIYFVFFENNKMTFPRLGGHRHKNEGFNNSNKIAVAGKSTLVLFHAEWCGYCKRFMPTWKDAKSKLQNDDVVLKEFEADEDSEVMKANNVSGYPTLKLFKSNGEVVNYEGDRTLKDLEKFIKKNK